MLRRCWVGVRRPPALLAWDRGVGDSALCSLLPKEAPLLSSEVSSHQGRLGWL